jgi:hypothetical protein
MAKIKHKSVKFSPEELDYELPEEVNLRKLRRAGSGIETVKRLAASSRRTIGLDPDVAKVFPDSEAVNGMLRAIISSMPK